MTAAAELEDLLEQGLSALELTCSKTDLARLLRFVELLQRWGAVYNLTAIEEPDRIIRLHLLDSLSIWPRVQGERVLDVGTGAGLPGIPLAVALPEKQFALLDRSAKKLRFVQQSIIDLGLRNAQVIHDRVERCAVTERFDTIVVRAYGSLADIWAQARHLLSERGVILAMKGREAELDPGALDGVSARITRLTVPGLEAERHLVELRPRS